MQENNLQQNQPTQAILVPTSMTKRVVHAILDYICYIIFSFVFGFMFGIIGLAKVIEDANGIVLGLILMFAYFILFETVWGKSPAKFITRTKVVNEDGSKPTASTIALRTLCRLIPFDFVSFFSSNPRGWHDKLSKTIVIND